MEKVKTALEAAEKLYDQLFDLALQEGNEYNCHLCEMANDIVHDLALRSLRAS